MEKKKLKLSISGSTNRTINSIEQAKTQSKNTVVIEKKPKRFLGKSQTARTVSANDKSNNNRIRLGIDQNDPTPLYKAQEIWGGSVNERIRKSPVSNKICICHTWRLSHNNALKFLRDIKPYLQIPYKINQIYHLQKKCY